MNKTCKICLKPIENVQTSRTYHPECFKLYRKQYQKKYQKTVKGVRFSIDVLKQEVDNLKNIIKEDVIKEIKTWPMPTKTNKKE
mgnify:CR=1 FL=1